jgi:hypothetical protein
VDIVTATMIVAKVNTPEHQIYLNRGDVLPDAVPAAEADRLVAAGLVRRVTPAAAPEPDPAPPGPDTPPGPDSGGSGQQRPPDGGQDDKGKAGKTPATK